jgi:hypothetical protein
MKKIALALVILAACFNLTAQETESLEETRGFKKENLFLGGSLNASFFNGATAFGISPYFGYNITKWLDAAVSVNFSYISQRHYYDDGKLRQTIVAPGAFVRIFPVSFLFAQAQFEHNFLTIKDIPPSNSGYSTNTFKTDVNSLLVGGGYASGREGGNKTYYYLSLSFDVFHLPNSPYVDNLQRTIPIINAGFNIALFQGRRDNYE